MPWLPAVAAIAGLAGTGVTVGETLANAGGGGPQVQAPAPTPPNQQQLAQQKALIGQQLPNVIGETSGLANPDYNALIAKILSGTLGQPGSQASGASATAQNFTPVGGSTTTAAVNNQPVNLSDFINSFSS